MHTRRGNTMNILYIIIAAHLLLYLLNIYFLWRIISELESKYPETYKKLGEPTIGWWRFYGWLNYKSHKDYDLMTFIFTKGKTGFNKNVLDSIKVFRVVFVTLLVGLVVALPLVFFYFNKNF